MSTSKNRFASLPWITKIGVGAAILILIIGAAWIWVPRTSQEDSKGPQPDPTITAAHQEIINALIAPIERAPNATPVPPKARAIQTDDGIITSLTIPIQRKENTTNAQFIADTKKEVATVLNTLFSSDTSVQRILVTTTYPRADGREAIVLSVIMTRKTWQDQGKITVDNIESFAQSFQVSKAFTH